MASVDRRLLHPVVGAGGGGDHHREQQPLAVPPRAPRRTGIQTYIQHVTLHTCSSTLAIIHPYLHTSHALAPKG
jgi:hypothetical protein